MQCLVIASQPSRRQDLTNSAIESGWRTFQAADQAEAFGSLHRLQIQLAIVDLGSVGEPSHESLRSVVEHLATQGEVLTVVCGGMGNPTEEIWARQLGVWIYLPGVIDPHDMQPILGEARDIAERLVLGRGAALAGAGT
jgi:DNA-binding response OmpR family regulator